MKQKEQNEFVTKYILEGPITTPDGRNPAIRTIWAVTEEVPSLRLVTAYPLD